MDTLRCVFCGREFAFDQNKIYCGQSCNTAVYRAIQSKLSPKVRGSIYIRNLIKESIDMGSDVYEIDIIDQNDINHDFWIKSCLKRLERVCGGVWAAKKLVTDYFDVYAKVS